MKFAAPALALVLAALALASLSVAPGRIVRRASAKTETVARAVSTAVELAGYLRSDPPWSPADDAHPFARAVAERGGRIEMEGNVVLVVLDPADRDSEGSAELRFLRGRVAGVRLTYGSITFVRTASRTRSAIDVRPSFSIRRLR